MAGLKELEKYARNIRIDLVKMLASAGSGHPAGSLGIVDILTTLYFGGLLKQDPKKPNWEERDRFLLSAGHLCPALYATLAHAGYFPKEELSTLRNLGSRLQGHSHHAVLANAGCRSAEVSADGQVCGGPVIQDDLSDTRCRMNAQHTARFFGHI